MPYDATLPVDHAKIVAAELRNQFNGLKDLFDNLNAFVGAQAGQIADLGAQVASLQSQLAAKAAAVPGVATLDPATVTMHNPLVPDDVTPLYDKVNELIEGLHGG